MNKQSNTYIVTYATILVVIVATVLSFAAVELQPMQQANVKTEKMGAILNAIGAGEGAEKAADKNSYIAEKFAEYITGAFFVDSTGHASDAPVEQVLASLDHLPAVFAAKAAMPVFVATLAGHTTEYVVPVTGKGLWGPVWGYIALNEDCNTIDGAVFDHKSETPGLGAEIAAKPFQDQFIDKQIFNKEGLFVSIDLLKGKGASAGNPYAVDAISGGTLTSNGVKAMLFTCLGDYEAFFRRVQTTATVEAVPAADTVAAVLPADTITVVPAADSAAVAADSLVMTENTEGGAN